MTAPSHPAGAREQTRTRHGSRRRRTRPIVTAALLSLAMTGLACTSGRPADAAALTARTVTAAAAGAGRMNPAEARLADRVPTPVLHWTTCRKTAQCATAELPLNYDHPHGATIKLALLRIKAQDPHNRLGTLFVNPGGPGDSTWTSCGAPWATAS